MPFTVLVDKLIFGVGVVLQHTPRAVTIDPPEFVIIPPLTAVDPVIEEIVVVVSLGTPKVLKLS